MSSSSSPSSKLFIGAIFLVGFGILYKSRREVEEEEEAQRQREQGQYQLTNDPPSSPSTSPYLHFCLSFMQLKSCLIPVLTFFTGSSQEGAEATAVIGLRNIGNTCYFNSLLQVR